MNEKFNETDGKKIEQVEIQVTEPLFFFKKAIFKKFLSYTNFGAIFFRDKYVHYSFGILASCIQELSDIVSQLNYNITTSITDEFLINRTACLQYRLQNMLQLCISK